MEQLSQLGTHSLGRALIRLEEVDSTNDYLKEHAAELPHGAVCMARSQTDGRGRLGKRWEDRPGLTLPFSVLLRDLPRNLLPVLPLVTGLAVCRGLEKLCGGDFRLKWSNDVLLESKKVCGILCENRSSRFLDSTVVGIGVNVAHTAADFAELNLVYATSLHLVTGKLHESAAVCASILNQMEPLLEICVQTGFASIRDAYKERCVNIGREVLVTGGGARRRGMCLDVGEDGSLICQTGEEVYPVFSGEASVRGIMGYF